MKSYLAVLACLLLVACDEPPKVRRITYWEKWTGFEGDAMQAVVKAFNARERARAEREEGYVPIEVEMVIVSQLHRKLLVAIAGDAAPDVAGGWTWMVYSYAEKDAMLPLDDLIAADAEIGEDDYLLAFWEMCRYDGKTWCLPTTPASTALHWNRRLFVEAGLDPAVPPKTIKELDEFARQLTRWEVTRANGKVEKLDGWHADLDLAKDDEARLVQAGFLPAEPGWWAWSWGFHFGGTLDDGAGQITADSPENRRAYEWCRSYVDRLGKDNIKKFSSGFGDFSTPQNAFLDGKVAMEIQGVWMYNFIEMYNPALDWDAAPFPHPADRPDLAGVSNVEADVIAIPTGSRHPEEAWEFIRFVQSREGMELLCLGQRKFSPLREVSDGFLERHPHKCIEVFRELALSPNGFSTPKLGVWNEYNRELGSLFTDIMGGTVAVDEGLAGVDERMQAVFDRNARLRRARGRE